MELDLAALLSKQPVVLLFLVIGLGYLVGKIKIRGFELGPAAGVLFAALFLGHYGYELPRFIETIGFVFFIYSVGFQSGPRFFRTFKRDGFSYITLALVVAASAVGLALLFNYLFDFDAGFSAGILGGALTSTPTLAAAQDAVNSGAFDLSAGLTAAQVNTNITVGYAITYVFGLVGLILFMRLFPRVLRIDMKKATDEMTRKMNVCDTEDDETCLQAQERPMMRNYQVSNREIAKKTLRDLGFIRATGCIILRVKRSEQIITPHADTVLEKGDIVAVVGTFPDQQKAIEMLGGPEVDAPDLRSFSTESDNVVIHSNLIAGRTLRESGIATRYNCLVDKLFRDGVELPLSLDLKLEKGDRLVLTGIKEHLDEAVTQVGQAERAVNETDLLTFAFGIVGGIIIGTITVKVGSLPVGIGMAGGLLIMGLLIGYLRSHNPTFGRVPPAARFILMEMGILFFLAGVGLRAGHDLLESLRTIGIQVFLAGALVTTVPILVGFVVGRVFLKMNPVILLGALAGAITSTPALNIINKTAKSTIPSLGYAGVYAFANIILTLAGQLIIRF